MDDEHVAFDDNVKQSDGTSLQRKQTGPTGEVRGGLVASQSSLVTGRLPGDRSGVISECTIPTLREIYDNISLHSQALEFNFMCCFTISRQSSTDIG